MKKGYKFSEEILKKRVETRRKNGNYHQSKETKEKIRQKLKGTHRPEEVKKKIREAQEGEKSYNYKHGFSVGENRKKYRNFIETRRKIRKLGNGGIHTFGDWQTLKAQYNWTCPSCRKLEPNIKLTEDHIIPISKGGSDNIENIQPLCMQCNQKKMTKIIRFKNIWL